MVNGRLYLLPEKVLAAGRLPLIRYGLLLGEVRRGYFQPNHALALALTARDVINSANFSANSAEIAAYLQGREMPSAGPDGWLLVMVDGYALGWGKRVKGHLKNHYPRGLRQMQDWRRAN